MNRSSFDDEEERAAVEAIIAERDALLIRVAALQEDLAIVQQQLRVGLPTSARDAERIASLEAEVVQLRGLVEEAEIRASGADAAMSIFTDEMFGEGWENE